LKALIASLLHVVHRSLIGISLTANELKIVSKIENSVWATIRTWPDSKRLDPVLPYLRGAVEARGQTEGRNGLEERFCAVLFQVVIRTKDKCDVVPVKKYLVKENRESCEN